MPKLWNHTIETHRAAVRDATLDAAAALVAEHGLTGITMSRLAAATGIGRATLYKYFPDVDSVLRAWHERQITRHLDHLTQVRERPGDPLTRLTTALAAYARMSSHHHDGPVAAMLHRDAHVGAAHQRLTALLGDLVRDAAAAGQVRTDVPADELATYCLHALTAAGALNSSAAVHRLVEVTVSALRPSCTSTSAVPPSPPEHETT